MQQPFETMDYITGGVHETIRNNPETFSWGGIKCLNYVPQEIHAYELAMWLLFLTSSYWYMNIPQIVKDMFASVTRLKKSSEKGELSPGMVWFGRLLFVVHFTVSAHLLCCKVNSQILLYLLQPCHIILFLQTVALVSSAETSCAIILYTIPPQVGGLLATVFPDTSGLDQFLEKEMYYVQHICITIITPVFLLVKYRYAARELLSARNIFVGVWMLIVYHWIVLESVDYLTMVNVDMMLCPSGAMTELFKAIPPVMLLPSYRTLVTIVVALMAWPLSWLHGVAPLLSNPNSTVGKYKLHPN